MSRQRCIEFKKSKNKNKNNPIFSTSQGQLAGRTCKRVLLIQVKIYIPSGGLVLELKSVTSETVSRNWGLWGVHVVEEKESSSRTQKLGLEKRLTPTGLPDLGPTVQLLWALFKICEITISTQAPLISHGCLTIQMEKENVLENAL